MTTPKNNVSLHPTSIAAKDDRLRDRENLARQMRTSQMMREQAREQINPTQLISELFEIDLALQGEKDSAGNPIPVDPDIQKALNARAAIKDKLLKKVLPDLKASESLNLNLHEHGGTIGIQKVSNVELAQRLQLWRRNHGQGHLMRAETEGEESCVEATFTEEKEFDFL